MTYLKDFNSLEIYEISKPKYNYGIEANLFLLVFYQF